MSYDILFVGNSFTYTCCVPGQLQTLARAHGIDITYRELTKGGATLSDSIDKALSDMQGIKFDYVVLQDKSIRALEDAESFFADVRKLCDAAKVGGAKPVLYSPAWANIDRLPAIEPLKASSDAYICAAKENDAKLVDAANAWIYAYDKMPNISFYAQDGLHQSCAGSFYVACMFAAMLFDLHIESIPDDSLYKGDDAFAIAQMAWGFVKNQGGLS
ncbi:MAG: hypothetical protein FWE34_08055 [Defluviitaleaceae bacterium]|nr:hypothetical protein [Defluviitaleaceae bacterium]